ncbi:MAG: radical SAM protein, partial [Erysipelotrichia bacterium]|nr:radical SAM protein [Erysipelotrichia bacterium]
MIKRAYIEILNECNLNCAFCRKNQRPPLIMSTGEFYRILKQVKKYTSYIYLHVQGEPMLHPQFEDILCICDAESVHVQLVTNGTMLHCYPNLSRHQCLRKV